MASDGPVDTLGRQCKAMAKAKAKAAVNVDDFIVAYSAELLASEAAGRLREEHRNAVAQTEMENEAAAAPSPWDDMHDHRRGFPMGRHNARCAVHQLPTAA